MALGLCGLFLSLSLLILMVAAQEHTEQKDVHRSSFPTGFIFGAASAAYQYEGAAAEGHRGPSIWDTFTHDHPEAIADRSTGDVAIDFYHRSKEDMGFLKYMGMDAFRFSISWSRILPNGSLSGGVNQEGVDYYNTLINDLLDHGLQPFVTLFHWDLPQGLESQYQGFLSPSIVNDFRDYSEICFKEFGDRVKHWITLNEPWTFCDRGYSSGIFAPGRCSPWTEGKCTEGDSSREPYLCAHHQLLSHAAAVKQYRRKYQVSSISIYIHLSYLIIYICRQASQKGMIGITLITHWFVPYSNSKSDEDAVSRALDFMFGWFMDPLTQGDYPFTMRAIVGNRLPKFTAKQSKMVRGSFDFIGLNYYTTYFANSISLLTKLNASYETDSYTLQSGKRQGTPIGTQAASDWLFVYPEGIREALLYLKNRYNNPIIYITENGVDEVNNASWPLNEALQDDMRVDYYKNHLYFVEKAIRDGVDVRGYFAWSLLDNFEWSDGYTVRFGIVYVDYRNGLKRYPKTSAHWFQEVLNN
ncbi:beta-glucosidase 12 isoform X1 [Musa acuminata AAA Group]|uniref:beta-glucosidase 12 isoform X1 n=1 Tax=Musa acuminata AAA Group TaxID=214697 RepID=UPI0031D195BA